MLFALKVIRQRMLPASQQLSISRRRRGHIHIMMLKDGVLKYTPHVQLLQLDIGEVAGKSIVVQLGWCVVKTPCS